MKKRHILFMAILSVVLLGSFVQAVQAGGKPKLGSFVHGAQTAGNPKLGSFVQAAQAGAKSELGSFVQRAQAGGKPELGSFVQSVPDKEIRFWGTADVSAGVFLDAEYFVVTDDETNILRIYKVGNPEQPAGQVDVSAFLEVDSAFPEADIEAVSRVDKRIYWITSHGRNKDGKPRQSRQRFFCMRIKEGSMPSLEPEGVACKSLAEQMIAYDSPVQETLEKATRYGDNMSKKEAEKLAPKRQGLNIEGLTCYPPNGSLLIGLRNPLYPSEAGKRAIVMEMLNPQEVTSGKPARFGQVLLWDLGGRGVRGMEYIGGRYLILAGPVDDETTCALYAWGGEPDSQPVMIYELPAEDRFTPEGLAEGPGGVWLFSDDGSLEVDIASPQECLPKELLPNGNCPNKFLADPSRKSFRVKIMDEKMPD